MDATKGNLGLVEEGISSAMWKRVFHNAYSLVGNRSEAEDITQEAFVVLFQETSSGRSVEYVGAWMKTVTRHLAYRHFRRQRPDLHLSLDAFGDAGSGISFDPVDPAPSAEKRVIDDNLLRLGAKILCQASEKDRECVMMYFRGYDFLQIATALGVSRWTARRATLKALQRLRSNIDRPRK